MIPANIVTNSTLSLEPLNPMRIASITTNRNGNSANDVKCTCRCHCLARVGGRYRHLDGAREIFDVELDVEYETWSRDEGVLRSTPMA